MSALVTSEIFRLFVNTLTPDDKYSLRYMPIFWQQIQTLLSQKGKTFYGFFIAFLKCAWNLEHSEKKEEYPSLIITEIIASERDVYLRDVNGIGTLPTLPLHHYFSVFPWIRDKLSWKKSALVTSEIFRVLTRWLPMTSIPVAICRFSNNNFKRLYLKKDRLFMDFLLHFWNVHEI